MYSAEYVDEQIKILADKIASGAVTPSEAAWELAMDCNLWAYVFGAYGEYCDPSNRRSRANPDHPTIKSKCKNFNGKDSAPAGCVGCKWFLGDASSDQSKHEGRTRFFDCRGYVYWVLKKLFNFWAKCPAGATTMWKTEANWSRKGLVKDGVPSGVLVCLFYPEKSDPKKMAHIGFGFNGETIECSNGVEHHTSYNKKWTHWAVPKCVETGYSAPEKEPASTGKPVVTYPTIRQGASGEVVVQLQFFLAQDGSGLQIDGVFGSGTASAVRAFQKRYGLVVDGIVGPKTWTKLLEVAGNIKISEPEKDDGGNPFREDYAHTLIVPNLTAEQAYELTQKYPKAVPVEYEDVKDYIG